MSFLQVVYFLWATMTSYLRARVFSLIRVRVTSFRASYARERCPFVSCEYNSTNRCWIWSLLLFNGNEYLLMFVLDFFQCAKRKANKTVCVFYFVQEWESQFEREAGMCGCWFLPSFEWLLSVSHCLCIEMPVSSHTLPMVKNLWG